MLIFVKLIFLIPRLLERFSLLGPGLALGFIPMIFYWVTRYLLHFLIMRRCLFLLRKF